jgi:hypothetical protein
MLGELPDQVVASLRGEPAPVGVERPTRGVDTRVETPPSVGPSIEMVHVARSPHRVGKDWRALVTSARRLQAGDALRVETMAGRLAAIVVEVAGELPSDGEYRSDVVTRLVNAEAMQSLLDANPCTAELDALRLRTLLFGLFAVDVRAARVGSSATAIVAGGTPATMHSSTTRRVPTVEEQLDKRDAPSMLGLRCTTGSKSDALPEIGRTVEIELANGETIRGVVSETKAESWRGVSVCVEGPEAVPTHHREDRRFCGRWYTGTNVMIDSDERRVSWRYMDSQTDSMRNPCVDIQMPTGASSFDELIEAAKRLTGLRVSMSTTLRGSSCERCRNTGILRGFTTPDRPCDEPSCIFRKLAAKSEGPKEWTVVGRCELLSEGVDLAASGSDTYAMQVVRAAKSLGDQARRSGMGADDDPVKWIEQHEGSTCGWSATYEFVLAQKDDQRIGFIVADYSEGPGRANGTAAVRLRDHRVFAGTAITVESVRRQWDGGKPIHPVAVHGERCRDMVVDRLVCGLRDGSIES